MEPRSPRAWARLAAPFACQMWPCCAQPFAAHQFHEWTGQYKLHQRGAETLPRCVLVSAGFACRSTGRFRQAIGELGSGCVRVRALIGRHVPVILAVVVRRLPGRFVTAAEARRLDVRHAGIACGGAVPTGMRSFGVGRPIGGGRVGLRREPRTTCRVVVPTAARLALVLWHLELHFWS